jgi:eukaryotic translation initiation factor 2C
MYEHLRAFHKHRGVMPAWIVFYRDGVAHSAFGAVCEPEIKAIKSAFKKLRISPDLLFTVVQKRNITRLWVESTPERQVRNASGKDVRWANGPAGTIIDEEVTMSLRTDADGSSEHTERHYFNFWLLSHFALQGTSRVPSYHVLENTNPSQMSKDNMEELAFDLCFLHFKCPRSISVPVPLYYADLAAKRAFDMLREIPRVGQPGPSLPTARNTLTLDADQSRRIFF